MQFWIESEDQRDALIDKLLSLKLPFQFNATLGSKRSLAQNRLLQKWYKEIGQQMYEDAEYARAYCKLHFGIPILRADNDQFKEKYDEFLKDKTYEHKMAAMVWPFELPVTSIMNIKQLTEYLEAMHRFFTEKGFHLTDPEIDKDSQP